MFRTVKPLTMLGSLSSFTLHLWDESAKKLIGFRAARRIREQRERDAQSKSRASDTTA